MHTVTKSPRPKLFYGYIIVGAAFLIMVVALGGNSVFGVFLAPMLDEFGWTRAVTTGAFSLRLIVYASLTILSGRITDKIGPRIPILIGGLCLGSAAMLMSRVHSVWQLYLLYGALSGIGLAGLFIPTLSTVARWFVRRRGIMSGVVMTGIGAGTIVMPLLAQALIDNYGWRESFLILGIIMTAVIVAGSRLFRRDPESRGLLPDGEVELNKGIPRPAPTGLTFRQALATRELWLFAAAYLCLGFALYTILAHVVISATGQGISAISAASILSIAGGTNIFGRLVMGNISDRFGSRPTLILGMALMSLSLVWLQFAHTLWPLYIFAAIFGFGWGGGLGQGSPMTAELFGMKSHGVLYGFVDAAFTVGAATGPVLIGYIYDAAGNYKLGFLIVAMVSITGFALSVVLRLVSGTARKYAARKA